MPQRPVVADRGRATSSPSTRGWARLRRGRAVRRLHLGLVLRDLPAAVRLAGRLHHPAGRGLRPGAPDARRPRTPAQPVPAARVRHRRRPRTGEPTVLERAARRAAPRSATGSVRGRLGRAAERGYLREAGNLVFHVSLLSLLLGVASVALFGFRGTSVVIVGSGLRQHLTQYDDFTTGGSVLRRPAQAVHRRRRAVRGRASRPAGAARSGPAVRADTEVTDRPGRRRYRQTIEVNHPLNVDGTDGAPDRPRLRAAGDGQGRQGDVAFSGPVVFLPQDGNFTSAGVIKAPDGRPERLAFEGIFAPTAMVDDAGPAVAVPRRAEPGALRQRLGRAAEGRDRASRRTSTPSTPTGLTQLKDAKGEPLRVAAAGRATSFDLPDGKGTISWTAGRAGSSCRSATPRASPISLGSIGARGARAVPLALRPAAPGLGARAGRAGSGVG